MPHAMLATLLTFALSGLALAGGQSPAPAAIAHPSTNAHANAIAGQADAARMEACGHVSTAMLDALGKDDFAAATIDFDSRMQSLLGARKLGAAWASIAAQLGKLESRGTPQTVMYGQTPVITTPLRFAKGRLSAQVACDKDGHIAGFHIQPVASGT